MLSVLAVALLVYGLMHAYALGRLWLALPHSWGLAMGLLVAGMLLTLSPFLVWFLERQGWHRPTVVAAWASHVWMGYLFLFVCVGLVSDFGFMLFRLVSPDLTMRPLMRLGAVGSASLGLLVYGYFEAQEIRIKRIDIVTPKLAAGHVTLAQLSDLHLGIMQGDRLLDRIGATLRALKPDIVVATGDIVDGQGDDFNQLARRVLPDRPPLGAYAVTGNHEYYAGLDHSLDFMRRAGFTMLRGHAVRVGGIVLAGVDDPTVTQSTQQARVQEDKALATTSRDDFVVLLKHQPIVSGHARFDLQLSGHVHGGQIFPFGYLTRLAYRFNTGLTELADGRRLHVSRGAGTWGPPIRLLAPPEITLITISTPGPGHASGARGSPVK